MSSLARAHAHLGFRIRVGSVDPRRASRRFAASAFAFRRRNTRASRIAMTRCEFDGDDKMYVPPGAFGGTTPERQASRMLSTMMTYIATWIVIDQTETVAPPSARRAVRTPPRRPTPRMAPRRARAAARITSTHDFLLSFLEQNPCRDGDAFMEALFATNPDVARRVAETRAWRTRRTISNGKTRGV